MTDDFDFDFDVNRGRSDSRSLGRDRDEAPQHGNGRDLGDPAIGEGRDLADREPGNGNGTSGNGARGYAARARDLLNRSQALIYREDEGRGDEPELAVDDAPAPPAPVEPPLRRRRTEPRSPAVEPSAERDDDWLSIEDDDLGEDITSLREHDEGPAGPPTPGGPATSPRRPAAVRPAAKARSWTSTASGSDWSGRAGPTRTAMRTSSRCSSVSRRRAASPAAARPYAMR
jgi:hypothetical protein